MKYAKEIEDAGLHNAVDKILAKFPHLEDNNESVPGIDDTLWYAIVNKIVPNYGWSNEDITAVLP